MPNGKSYCINLIGCVRARGRGGPIGRQTSSGVRGSRGWLNLDSLVLWTAAVTDGRSAAGVMLRGGQK